MNAFQITFVNPDRPEFEITEIVHDSDVDSAAAQIQTKYPQAEIISTQQLHKFAKFREG